MVFILEGIFKGFVQWVYSLCLEMVQYIANSLLEVFQMDLSYFRQVAPVTDDILSIVIAVGWALLLGNLVFQAVKSMAIGLGFEGDGLALVALGVVLDVDIPDAVVVVLQLQVVAVQGVGEDVLHLSLIHI